MFMLGFVAAMGISVFLGWFLEDGQDKSYQVIKRGEDWVIAKGNEWLSKHCEFYHKNIYSPPYDSEPRLFTTRIEAVQHLEDVLLWSEDSECRVVYERGRSPACRLKRAIYNWLKQEC